MTLPTPQPVTETGLSRRGLLAAAAAAPVLPLAAAQSEALAPLVANVLRGAIPDGNPCTYLSVRKDALLALCQAVGQGADNWVFSYGQTGRYPGT